MIFLLSMIENEETRTYLENLYYDYKKISYGNALRIVKNPRDAEDIVHQVYMKIAEYLDNHKKVVIKNDKAFIYKVTQNIALNHVKAKKEHLNLDEIAEVENITFIEPEVNVLRMDQIKEHTKKLEQLNQDYASIIMLKYTEELSITEIATLLNLTEDNTRMRLSRARRAFKNILKEGEMDA